MAEIVLTNGKIVLVDEEDFIRLNEYRWYQSSDGYAIARINRKLVRMHRFILNLEDKTEIDHKNHNKIDNRKENLRVATKSQNLANQLKRKEETSSKYKGVHWYKRDKKWQVHCKAQYLGRYTNETDAARIYDEAAQRLFGEFACLNFK